MDCRLGNKAELQKALSIVEKHGLKTIPKEEEGMTPLERLYLRARKNAEVVSIPDEENEIEVIPAEEEHAADCGIWADNECDCK